LELVAAFVGIRMTRCIFWEPNTPHTRLSREHIWGKWLKAYVQSTMKKHHMQEEVVGRPGTPISIKSTIRAGDPLKSKIKIVCEACNNGWMSRIQQRAKPFLIPLIEGSTSVLGTVAQKAIATWCVMATMTAEYLTHDLTSIAISQADRDWFRDHGSPPENWKIWIGRYHGNRGQWTHFVVPVLSRGTTNSADDRRAAPNTQTTTFIVGRLLVHVMSTSGDPDIISRWVWPLGSRLAVHLPQIFRKHPARTALSA
jgi:hypothetical protein